VNGPDNGQARVGPGCGTPVYARGRSGAAQNRGDLRL